MFLRDKKAGPLCNCLTDRTTDTAIIRYDWADTVNIFGCVKTGRQPIQNGRRHQNSGQQWASELTALYTTPKLRSTVGL